MSPDRRVGRKVFDDGCSIPEKQLVEIGDGATINAEVIIQGHSLEDRLYKADRIKSVSGRRWRQVHSCTTARSWSQAACSMPTVS